MRLVPLLVLLCGCAVQPPAPAWVKQDSSTEQADMTACRAEGYKTAGPMPQYQPTPDDCKKGGFACGAEIAAIRKSNAEARATWEDAYDTGVTACMNARGYARQ